MTTLMGDKMPESGDIFLPAVFTKKQVYEMYKHDHDGLLHLKKSAFHNVEY